MLEPIVKVAVGAPWRGAHGVRIDRAHLGEALRFGMGQRRDVDSRRAAEQPGQSRLLKPVHMTPSLEPCRRPGQDREIVLAVIRKRRIGAVVLNVVAMPKVAVIGVSKVTPATHSFTELVVNGSMNGLKHRSSS